MLRIVLIVLLGFVNLKAFCLDSVAVYDLSSRWKTLDKDGEPHIFESDNPNVLFFEINDLYLPNQKLKIEYNQSIDIWLDGRLIDSDIKKSKVIDIDSIIEKYGRANEILFYSEEGFSENLSTSLITPISGYSIDSVVPRKNFKQLDNWFLLTVLIVLISAGVYRRYFSIAFKRAFENPLKSKVRSLSAEENYFGFASQENFATIIFLSILISTVMLSLWFSSNWNTGLTIAKLQLYWFWVVLFSALSISIKYFWIYLSTKIFEFKELVNVQIQDQINFYIPIFSGSFGLLVLDFSLFDFNSEKLKNMIIYALIISQIFFLFWIYFKIDNFYRDRKLLIFFYLCASEFIPGALIIHWLGELL